MNQLLQRRGRDRQPSVAGLPTWGRNGMEHGPMGHRLLSGMCSGATESWVNSVLVIDRQGREQVVEGTRLLDLAVALWPNEKSDSFCRALRFITDVSKRDFLLRPWRNNFLVRADFTRAIVEEDRVLFLGPKTATFDEFKPEFVKALEVRARDPEERMERPFDLWALECIVCANVTMHTMRLQVMRPVITSIVSSMDLHGSERSILRLYPLKVALSKFIEQVKPLVACLKDLLEAESQNQGIEETRPLSPTRVETSRSGSFGPESFSAVVEQPVEASGGTGDEPRLPSTSSSDVRRGAGEGGPGSAAGSDSSTGTEDLHRPTSGFEELLETWALNAQEVMADAVEMNANIEDATRFMEASMSYSRTSLLRLELVAMVVGLAFAFGALVSGIFGMNLKSPIFEVDASEGLFNYAVLGIVVVGCLIVLISFCLFQRGKRHYRRYCERFGRNEFFRQIENDEYVLKLSTLQTADGNMSQAACEQVWRDLKTPAPPLQPYQNVPRDSAGFHRMTSVASTPVSHGAAEGGRRQSSSWAVGRESVRSVSAAVSDRPSVPPSAISSSAGAPLLGLEASQASPATSKRSRNPSPSSSFSGANNKAGDKARMPSPPPVDSPASSTQKGSARLAPEPWRQPRPA